MDRELRSYFDARWDDALYPSLVAAVNDPHYWQADFRICETPIFFSDDFIREAVEAGADIVRQIRQPAFALHAARAVPPGQSVPGDSPHPHFIQIDFAVAEEQGTLRPKLIELQGFASLFCYQVALDRAYRDLDLVPPGTTCYFSGLSEATYLESLRQTICGDVPVEHVVLLEIEPERQRTRVDFACTHAMLGVRPLCISAVKKSGRTLYYEDNGKVEIRRIYNRVIFDELNQRDLHLEFHPADEVDVEWAAHPNWFHRLSKHTLPYLVGEAIPESTVVADLAALPPDLENYVLKPLYSFAGSGVKVNVTREDLEQCPEPEHTLLQRKVKYAEFLETPTGPSKAEIRLMYLWDQAPILANTLVRVSRGALSSVSKNTSDTWIGATTGYHRVELAL